ncbi:protein enhancer of rudimentary-like [Ctenocephalides felis]|uniref:protein enhancer of rudimentary-like n=1 Tax=Ctenocephalides felis TaxID=7515 RepID=UPI000E6E4DE3|nr:protein enhancer of rudimentary-like [Ctenocephalides felis]
MSRDDYDKDKIILFIQYRPNERTRTYLKFNEPKELIIYIFKKCAEDLDIESSGDKVSIGYENLCTYIDKVFDINIFLKQPGLNVYKPYNRDWIKTQFLQYASS